MTLRRSEIFQHLVLKPITLFAQNGRSRFQQLEELKDWITDRPFLHWLWIDMVLHDHFKSKLVMHRSILMRTSCSNISILNAASKQSRIKLHQNWCFHLVLPIYCITCFDCLGFTPQRGSLGSSLDGQVRPPPIISTNSKLNKISGLSAF